MKRHISIVLMATWDCVLFCAYCYVRATRRNRSSIHQNQLETLMKNCSEGYDSLEFCWHGGEPLLLGKDFYRKVVKIQERISEQTGVKFENVIQTNGVLLDEEWLKLIKEINFSVGLSIDAPIEMHLKYRPHCNRNMKLEDWKKIWELVKYYRGSLGCLCVVTKDNVTRAKEIFDLFKELGASTYSLLPLKKMPNLDCPESPSNEALAKLYCDTFELWTNTPNTFTSIEPLETMVAGILGRRPLLCSFSASCLKRMITIDPSGNIVPCASLIADKFVLGNIFEETLIRVMNNKKVRDFKNKRQASMNKYCNNCEYIAICRGGCRNTAFWTSNDYELSKYPYCESRKRTFNYLRVRLREILTPT
ncbi:MAG: radical SAM protein [Patescibacteria group bacterium]